MEKEFVEGKIGTAGEYGVKFSGSKLIAGAELAAGPVKGIVQVELDAIDVACASIDFICEKIPGEMDNVVGAGLKAKLLELKAQG